MLLPLHCSAGILCILPFKDVQEHKLSLYKSSAAKLGDVDHVINTVLRGKINAKIPH